MKKYLKKLFCWHLVWEEVLPDNEVEIIKARFAQPYPASIVSTGKIWECKECHKRIAKPSNWIPINYIAG